MKLFGSIAPESRILDVAFAIYALASERGLLKAKEWSCAELGLDSEDYQWLKEYICRLDSYTVREYLRPDGRIKHQSKYYAAQPVFGLVLIVYESELARRETREGTIWPILSKGFPASIRDQLFLQNSNPTSLHRDILEHTAQRYRLRNVFGKEGVCEWLNSIFLQFGFTYRGFRARLPEWLVGITLPVAVESLLLSSNSFKQMWEALKSYHNKNLKKEQLLRQLRQSPWVLPEWHEDLLEAASRQRATEVQLEDSYFLSEPELTLDSKRANFTSTIINLADLGLTESKYYVQVNRRRTADLIKQSDGSYRVFPEVLDLGFSESVLVEIVNSSGQVCQSDFLELWDGEVTVYNLASRVRQRDALTKGLVRNSEYILIVNRDMHIQPACVEWEQAGRKLIRLPKDWSTDTVLTLDDEPYWEIREARRNRSLPAWADEVKVIPKGSSHFLKKRFYVEVECPPEVKVLSVRFCGESVNLKEGEFNKVTVGPLKLNFQMAGESLPIKVRLKKNKETCVIEIDLVPIYEAPMFKSQELEIDLDEHKELRVKQIEAGRLKIFATVLHPKIARGTVGQREEYLQSSLKEWGLVECNEWLTRLRRSNITLGGISGHLIGLGAPLLLIKGPYNSDSQRTLVRSVVDTGVIQQANISNGVFTIQLYSEIEPSPEHRVVLMDSEGRPCLLQPEMGDDHSLWRVEQGVDPIAVAVAYRGVRVGSWACFDWYKSLSEPSDAMEVAALVRWMRLPILSKGLREKIKAFYEAYPREVTAAWVHDKGLVEGLKFDCSDKWKKAMRTLMSYLTIDSSMAKAIFEEIRDEKPEEDVIDRWRRAVGYLIDIDPIIMGKVLSCMINDAPDRQSIKYVISDVKSSLLEEVSSDKTALELCSEEMEVDSYFTKSLLNSGVKLLRGESINKRNLIFAINNNSRFRCLLALKILEELLSRLK